MQILIRDEKPDDIKSIFNLIKNVFKNAPHTNHAEQFIVDALRRSHHLTISMVAQIGGKIVGHVAISPVAISSGAEEWYGLGPISVAPGHQGQGVGGKLMAASLDRLHAIGGHGCVVLGDPNYYSRFGFQANSRLVLPDIPAEYFQALCLKGDIPYGYVRYHDAFNS